MIKKYVDLWLAEMRKPETCKHKAELENFYNANEMCCLGHACKALKEPLDLLYTRGDGSVHVEGLTSELPDSVSRALGITNAGSIRDGKVIELEKWMETKFDFDRFDRSVSSTGTLISLNDSTDLTIEQIADVIEYCYDNDFFMRTT